MIFDGRYVFTGSFNFSKRTKMRNAEKILLIDEPSLAPDLNRKHQQKSDAGKKSEG
jgi:phosphatidylserine/phosphatidylglycerophosphate/cardiolipin synthase-like enzyme